MKIVPKKITLPYQRISVYQKLKSIKPGTSYNTHYTVKKDTDPIYSQGYIFINYPTNNNNYRSMYIEYKDLASFLKSYNSRCKSCIWIIYQLMKQDYIKLRVIQHFNKKEIKKLLTNYPEFIEFFI